MHDALGDALVVEVRDLLAQDEVFEQRGAAQPRLQRVLVVADRDALIRRQRTARRIDAHALERILPGIGPRRRRLAGLRARVALGQRAAADARMRRLDVLTRLRRQRRLLELARLRGVERERLGDELGRRRFRSRGIANRSRRTRRAADRAARRRDLRTSRQVFLRHQRTYPWFPMFSSTGTGTVNAGARFPQTPSSICRWRRAE